MQSRATGGDLVKQL